MMTMCFSFCFLQRWLSPTLVRARASRASTPCTLEVTILAFLLPRDDGTDRDILCLIYHSYHSFRRWVYARGLHLPIHSWGLEIPRRFLYHIDCGRPYAREVYIGIGR